MNLYVYFSSRSDCYPDVLPEHQAWFEQAWYRLLKKNPDRQTKERILSEAAAGLSDPLKDPEDIQTTKDHFDARVKNLKSSVWDECSDIFIFIFCYVGLFQGLYVNYIEPMFLEESSFSYTMELGPDLLFTTLVVYFILKGVLLVLASRTVSWKRWLALGGMFFVYIGCLWLSHYMPAGIYVPVWSVVLATGALALGVHINMTKTKLARNRAVKALPEEQ